ncbi:replication factor C subunit 3-like [Hydractinia symbiolongicarpus]|uniref:replication factor C subunit 3-like n=1 Tax=Hydractinia symbiolongicarpus TaxID=13093 RepID=UPI00254A8506|nr:replication factor C subunit 3-like [Hydractinia symbiolongicarpus]
MSLWIDKHRPSTFSKLTYHLEQSQNLKRLISSGDFPHMLIYGPPGSGKKTRISCLLRELYGASVEKLKLEQQTFLTPSKKKIEISTIGSNYHIEVNPSDAGINDRVVIQELIKTTAQTHQFDSSSQKSFKVVVLMETDKLTKDAQHALRRTMEKYVGSCRIILCCNSTSKVIPAIRSRCLGIRVAAPSIEEVIQGLNSVCKKEGLNLPSELAKRIAEKSKGNMRRALLMCEACRVQQYPFTPDQVIQEADWEVFLKQTASLIIEQQTPKRLLEVRSRLYELLTHCIPPDIIIKGLLAELVKNCDGSLKSELTQLAAHYEHRLQLGTKAIYHLEAFVAKFMSIYKRFFEEGMAGMF